jgi:small subunit ribosomal protein S10
MGVQPRVGLLRSTHFPRCQLAFSSYDQPMLDVFVRFCRSIAASLDMRITGSIPLPTHIRKFTVLKSPHVHKKHRDQLEIRTHKRLLEVSDTSDATLDTYLAYVKTHIPGEIGMKLSRYSYERPGDDRADEVDKDDGNDKIPDDAEGDKIDAYGKRAKLNVKGEYGGIDEDDSGDRDGEHDKSGKRE